MSHPTSNAHAGADSPPILRQFSLSGRTALVTGSTQGIGFALARGLAQAGAAVILNGRDPAKLERAVFTLASEGFSASGLQFDVADEKEVNLSISRIESKGGSIDILVNNAGIQRRNTLLETPLEDWRLLLETNLTSSFLTAKVVVPGMIGRGGGKIVNVCSLMSDLARPTTGGYAAAKGGLKMLTKAMCAEWAKENIQINGIAPGYFVTPLTQSLVDDPKFDAWIKARTPAQRWGRVEELAGACVFLASTASNFVNGQILSVDGGLSAVI